MKFNNDNEQTLWASILVAYLQQGGDTTKGAHLKFADRCIEGMRKRQAPNQHKASLIEQAVTPYINGHRTAKEVASTVTSIIRELPGKKISQIKEVRTHLYLGLKEAKDLVEAVTPLMELS